MKQYLLTLLITLTSVVAYSASYDDFYDNKGIGQRASEYYDDTAIKENPSAYYDDRGYDRSDIPSFNDVFGNSTTDYRQLGKDTGSSSTGKVGSEDALKSNVMKPMQSGTVFTTLGDTYICIDDNNTYGDINECRSKCSKVCDKYYFSANLSCQNAKEILTVTPTHIGVSPQMTINYDGKTFTTMPVTAVCTNGYVSSPRTFQWIATGGEIGVKDTGGDLKSLGDCEDVKGKSLMAFSRNYYNKMEVAFMNMLSKMGYIPSSEVKTMSGGMIGLSFSTIMAGSCDEGGLTTSMPNASVIKAAEDGKRPIDPTAAANIAKADPIYNMLTADKGYRIFNCSESTKPVYNDVTKGVDFVSTNNCASVPKECELLTESVCNLTDTQCIDRIANKVATGKHIPKFCDDIVLGNDLHKVCDDGSRITLIGVIKANIPNKRLSIKREYECIDKQKDQYDFSEFVQQGNQISQSADLKEDGTFSYSYYDKDGKLQTSVSNYELEDYKCPQSCKVQVPAKTASDNETLLLPDSSTASKIIDPVMYRSCKEERSNWVCELNPGEKLISDCDCLDDFVDTFVSLKIVDEITKNKKCSTK